jgi:hypothetical protein
LEGFWVVYLHSRMTLQRAQSSRTSMRESGELAFPGRILSRVGVTIVRDYVELLRGVAV